jgi:hypothetical protein
VTRSARLLTAALLAGALLPIASPPALASTVVVDAPLPAPTGLAPSDNRQTFPQTVRKDVFLKWDAVDGATGYKVQVGTDDTWSDAPALEMTTSNTGAVVPVGSLPYATYTWRVAALKGTVPGHWTSEVTNSQNAVQFTKGWRKAPTALTPVDGAVVDWPDFSWTGVPEAGAYRVVVNTGSPLVVLTELLPDSAFECITTRTRLTPFDLGEGGCPDAYGTDKPALLPGKTYYWTVSGIDVGAKGGKEYSLPSSARSFTMSGTAVSPTPTPTASASPSASPSAPPAALPTVNPVLASIDNDPDHLCTATGPARWLCSDVPTIRWTAGADPGRDHFVLYLSPDSLFQNVVDTIETKGTSWTSTKGLAEMSPTQSMYFAVVACNKDKACTLGAPGSTPSFRKVTPALGNLLSPTKTGLAVFSWEPLQKVLAAAEKPAGALDTASQDAATYHLQVTRSDAPSFATTVLDETVDGVVPLSGDFPDTSQPTWFNEGNQLGDGSYLWRVQAVDASGHKLPWSSPAAFTRDATPPSLITVSPTANIASKQPLKLQFSEDVTGVSASSVVLDPAVPATVAVTGPSTATLTPTQPLVPGATYTVRVRSAVKDAPGNSALPDGPSVTVKLLADDTSPAISYSSGWRPFSATNAVGGRYYRSTPTATSHPTASLKFYGTGVSYYTCLAPSNGYVDVYIDGTRRIRKSLYRSYSGCGIKIYAITRLTKGYHTIKLTSVGAKATASKGVNVSMDAFNVAA